jgi:hypothetical protein
MSKHSNVGADVEPAYRRKKAFARWSGLSIPTIDRAIRKGDLVKAKVGRATLIEMESGKRWLKSRHVTREGDR